MKDYKSMADEQVNKLISKTIGVEGSDGMISYPGIGLWESDVIPDFCNTPEYAWPVINLIWGDLMSCQAYDLGLGLGDSMVTTWVIQMKLNKCGKIKAAMITYLKLEGIRS